MNQDFAKKIRTNLVGRWLLVCLVFFSASPGAQTNPQSFDVPGRGKLSLQVPAGWTAKVTASPKKDIPTLTFLSAKPEEFQVLLTPLWWQESGKGFSDEELQVVTYRALLSAKAQSVESAIAMQDFKGAAGAGRYFKATDKAPKPGEFKFLMQGSLQLGRAGLLFTVLANESGLPAQEAALRMLKTARLVER